MIPGLFLINWLSIVFVSKVDSSCPLPDLPEHSVTISVKKPTYDDGENFKYKCAKDYHFSNGAVPQHKMQCIKGGWMPKNLWKCVDACNNRCQHGSCVKTSDRIWCQCDENYVGQNCDKDVCDAPKLSRHLSTQTLTGSATGNKFTVGSRIKYICHNGYQITKGYSLAYCRKGSGWVPPEVPVCEEVSCNNQGNEHGANYHPMNVTYRTGASIHFWCDHNKRLIGTTSVTCTIDGWLPSQWPHCIDQYCKDPPSVLHSVKEIHPPFAVGSIVTYTCTSGYVLLGNDEITCTRKQQMVWSGELPRCVTENEFSQYCARQNRQMVRSSKGGKYECAIYTRVTQVEIHSQKPKISESTSAKPLMIVTATAGGLLLLLLMVISLVACQRRRLARNRRRSGRQRMNSDDDRYSFVYYSNDVHVVLPSYDEAVQARRLHPPPYAGEGNLNISIPGQANTTNVETPARSSEENPYATIAEIPATTTTTPTASVGTHPAPSNSSVEPVYATVQRDLITNTQETSNDESVSADNSQNRDNADRQSISSNEMNNDDTAPLINDD